MALGDSSVSPELDTQTSEETPTANPVKLTPLGWSVGSPVEDLILATKTYVVGSFEAGAWIITGGDLQSRNTRHGGHTKWLRSKSKAGDVYTLVRHSRELFDHSDLEHGGLFLRRGFSSMGAVLTGEDPFAVWELMNTVSYLHEVSWTEVLHSFLKHLAEISAITHTRFHPIYRMFERLRGLASTEMLHVMASMRQCAAEEVEKFTGPTAISALKLRLGWLRSLSLIQNRESVEDVFGTLLEMSQAQFGQDEVRSLLILNRIGNSLQERHLYDAAEATGREIVSLAKDRSHTEAAIAFRGRGLSLMCRAQVAQGNFHGARASLDELFDFNTAYHGRTDPLTVVTMLMLENCLQASGEDLEAEKIRARRSHFTILMSDL